MSEFNFTAARINALKPVEKDTWHKDTTKGKNATGLWLRQRKTELAKSSTLHKPKVYRWFFNVGVYGLH